MIPVAGVFETREDARRTVEQLRFSLGIDRQSVNVLFPDDADRLHRRVPTTDAEAPGVGAAIGGVVGGGVGAYGSLAIASTLLVPGVGAVSAIGIAAAAILGALAGAFAGDTLDRYLETGLPADELFVYEDALRHGRSVVIVFCPDKAEADIVRKQMAAAGAESIDAARERWSVGTRDASDETYDVDDASLERMGFEAAKIPTLRGRSYEDAVDELRRRFPHAYREAAFFRGYEAGQEEAGSSAERLRLS